jgi:xylan 1,4-beta-xylosidase
MLERLAEDELACTVEGDGGGSLVEAWASHDPDGRVAIAVWNGTLDQSKAGGDVALGRWIRLAIRGLPSGSFELRHQRIDAGHSNIVATWEILGRPDWPDEDGWSRLRAANHLEALEPPRRVTADRGSIELEFDLPMPSMSFLELVPG